MRLSEYIKEKALPLGFLTEQLGLREENGRLLIPYYHADGSEYRVRYRQGDRRWWSDGDELIPYGLWLYAYDSGEMIFLCEGESDTQTLWHHGFPALGIPGASTYKPEWTDYVRRFRKIYLVPDTDQAGETFTKKTIQGLREAGYLNEVFIVHLPNGVKDVNELHKKEPGHRFDSIFTKLIKKAEKVESIRVSLPFIKLADMPKPSSIQYVVEDILPADYITLWFGDGGQGKSYLALALACSIAADRRFLNRETVAGLVVYIDFELNQTEQARRAYKVARGFGLTRPPDNLYYLAPGIQDGVTNSLEKLIEKLKQAITSLKPALIIIDSLGAALEGDPESARDVCRLFQQLRKLGTVLVIDHQSKLLSGDKYKEKTAFGSVYKQNLSRNIWQLQVIDNQPGELTLIMRHKKSNFGPLHEPIGLVARFDDSFTLQETALGVEFAEHLGTKEQVIAALRELKQATAKAIAEELELNLGTVRNTLTSLKKAGKVKEVGKDRQAPVYTLGETSQLHASYSEVKNEISEESFGEVLEL
jgi:RecA-family ATPase/DNA-binding transcriptional ArsR family regulator